MTCMIRRVLPNGIAFVTPNDFLVDGYVYNVYYPNSTIYLEAVAFVASQTPELIALKPTDHTKVFEKVALGYSVQLKTG